MFPTERVLDYEPREPKVSRAAVVVFVAAIASVCAFFFVVPSAVVLVWALGVRSRLIASRTNFRGIGLASAAITVSGCGTLAGLVFLLLMPSVSSTRLGGHSSTCSANLRGLTQSMAVYSADNSDSFPIIPHAPYASVPNAPAGKAAFGTVDGVWKDVYLGTSDQRGSVPGCMWVLVLAGQVSPKQFMCPQDPFADYHNAANTVDGGGNYYANFQKGNQLSYSMAYPWSADGKTGAWWNSANADSEVPILADMTPRQGTGKPARNVTPSAAPTDNRMWNSGNHGGDGQNVAYGDAHAEFQRRPDVGQDHDNIYSMSGSPSKGPAQFGGIAAGAGVPLLGAEKGPWDIIMLPVRDETTGGM